MSCERPLIFILQQMQRQWKVLSKGETMTWFAFLINHSGCCMVDNFKRSQRGGCGSHHGKLWWDLDPRSRTDYTTANRKKKTDVIYPGEKEQTIQSLKLETWSLSMLHSSPLSSKFNQLLSSTNSASSLALKSVSHSPLSLLLVPLFSSFQTMVMWKCE